MPKIKEKIKKASDEVKDVYEDYEPDHKDLIAIEEANAQHRKCERVTEDLKKNWSENLESIPIYKLD